MSMCTFVTYMCRCYIQVSANGNVLRSEIVGAVKMRVYLSGMPELRLGLNDKVLFESTGSKSTLAFLLFIPQLWQLASIMLACPVKWCPTAGYHHRLLPPRISINS